MSALPYPPPMAGLLSRGDPATNRSLLLDRGFDRYGTDWTVPAGGGFQFLADFRSAFTQGGGDFPRFVERRHRTLVDGLGARCVPLTTATRLVVGLGLPQPLETGFLLDRLTGCPYLPGSSVKGLLRTAAGLVAAGELAVEKPVGARDFWSEHRDALFGPDASDGTELAQGLALFADAFPAAWPALEIDVLTPHHRAYHEGVQAGALPGDWEDPVPIPLLTVAAGTAFNFYLASRRPAQERDLDQLAALLGLALDWLGAGGKKAAGYGTFEAPRPAAARR